MDQNLSLKEKELLLLNDQMK